MKKLILSVFALVVCVVANAANYIVTVSTQKNVTFYDAKTNDVVDRCTEIGNALTFDVVADTPHEAEQIALSRCQGACDSGIEVLVAQNVYHKNKLCNKYVRTVPFEAQAKLK